MSQQRFATISALFTAIAAEFAGLSESTTHVEMSGSEFIASVEQLDEPAPGPATTGGPAVFSGADVAAAFTPAPAPAPKVFKDIFTMLPAAGAWTRQQLLDNGQGWTDELLVSNGMMTIETVEVVQAPKPPAPAPIAPPAPTPAANTQSAGTPTPGAIDLDAKGLPWDARIHSGGRTKKANGEWVAKKNVQPAIVTQVTAELLQGGGKVAAPFVQPQAAPVPLATSAAAATITPVAVPAPPAPAGNPNAAAAAIAQAKALAALPPVPTNFMEFLTYVGANGHGTHMQAIGASLGLAGFGLLGQPENLHLLPTAWQKLHELIGA